MVVGVGIGVPLALLALGLGSWALIERRMRQHGVNGVTQSGVNGGLPPTSEEMPGENGEKAELVRSQPTSPYGYHPSCQLVSVAISDRAV